MPAYTAYGLRIDSDIPLPDLISVEGGDAAPDVLVRKGRVDPGQPNATDEVCRRASRDEVCLHYDGLATLLVERGCQITVDSPDGAPHGLLRLILQGPALGVILHQRGFLVLHASAVHVGSKTIAFVGDKGAGKSTTAAAFHARRYPVVSDDVLAVTPQSLTVYPAFPLIKLWDTAAAHVHGPTSDLEKLNPSVEKFGLSVAGRFAAGPSQLAHVFSLSDGDTLSIEKLPPQHGFMELVRNSYMVTLLKSTDTAASHFHQAIAVAGRVPVWRLTRPLSLPGLDDLVQRVVAHVA